MKKLLTLLAGILLSLSVIAVGSPATAQIANKVVVTPGMNIDYGKNGPVCTLGVVGNDRFGNLVGISAAHCLTVGQDVFFPGRRDLGPIGKTTFSYPNGGTPGAEPDYSVIKYDATKVVLDSDGRVRVDGVAAPNPRFGLSVCKGGSTTGVTCGVYTYTEPKGNYAGYILTLPGDSGGPLVSGTKWLGITSRFQPFQWQGVFSFASAHAILNDLAKRPNDIGAGFVPTNA